jgi:putative heme-binding domain-containing protein
MLRVGLLLLAAGALCAQNPMAGNREAVETGRESFRIHCSPCHGIRGEGGRGPDLTRGTFSAGDQDKDLFQVISDGVSGTEMQSYSLMLGDEGVWRVVAYIRSIARAETTPPKGDAAAGAKLFWGKGSCGNCHVVGTRGGHLGPDLTRVGRQRSLAYLRESVVEPSEDLTTGYFTITVVTPDGRQITGVQRGYDNFSVQLMDTTEKFYSFQRSETRSVKREYRSLMPEGYGRMFSAAEMDDLLAYLVSLRAMEVAK